MNQIKHSREFQIGDLFTHRFGARIYTVLKIVDDTEGRMLFAHSSSGSEEFFLADECKSVEGR